MLRPGQTIEQLVARVLYELGDEDAEIWDRTTLYRYARAGYEGLVVNAKLIWGVTYLEDRPHVGNYTQAWEKSATYVYSGFRFYAQFNTTSAAENEYMDNLTQRATMTAAFEEDYLSFLQTEFIAPVLPLPSDARKVCRATWDRRAISPMRRRELQEIDYRFQLTEGPVVAYSLDTDGLMNFRKYRVPTTRATYYTLGAIGQPFGILRGAVSTAVTSATSAGQRIDEFGSSADGSFSAADRSRFATFGMTTPVGGSATAVSGSAITTLTGFVGYTVVGRFGVLRRAPGLHAVGTQGNIGGFGVVRRIHHYNNNTRVEYWGVGRQPSDLGSVRFEIPRIYVRYLKHYLKWRAYDIDGPGHSEKLAGLYRARYLAGVARAQRRHVLSKKIVVAGSHAGGSLGGGKPPRPKLPWNYGRTSRIPY